MSRPDGGSAPASEARSSVSASDQDPESAVASTAGPIARRERVAARASPSSPTGPVGVGQEQAAGPVEHGGQRVGGQPARHRHQVALGAGRRRDPARQRPARGPGGGGQVRRVGRLLADQHPRQLVTAAAAQVLDFPPGPGRSPRPSRPRARRCRRRSPRPAGSAARRSRSARRPAAATPPPGDPGADPVGRQQRVERPALALLAAAEPRRRRRVRARAGVGVADQGDELAQRLLTPRADPAAEAPSSGRAYSGTSRRSSRGSPRSIARSSGSIASATRGREPAPGLVNRRFFVESD